tara:strand:- start:4143 stop:4664 length:522 start_codon:yes stop_codon:yes gene_type:complete
MTIIPVLQNTTQVNIPGIGECDAKCLAGGYVFHCRVPSHNPVPPLSSAYKPTMAITPNQRNAAIAQWWLDNCFPIIRHVCKNMTDTEEDTANAFGWWLSAEARFIQVDGWERDVWRGFAVDILDDVKNNHVTFKQATGIDQRTPVRPRLCWPPHFTPPPALQPPPLKRSAVIS